MEPLQTTDLTGLGSDVGLRDPLSRKIDHITEETFMKRLTVLIYEGRNHDRHTTQTRVLRIIDDLNQARTPNQEDLLTLLNSSGNQRREYGPNPANGLFIANLYACRHRRDY